LGNILSSRVCQASDSAIALPADPPYYGGVLPQWVIENKRDGRVLAPEEIRALIQAYVAGELPDYQMAALAMAVYFRGMTAAETAALTDAMMRSGDVLDFTGWPRPTADKHSTGGIGDKISLILAPLAASAGLAVPMISGRGLGITGGTLDKLESIPGFNTRLDVPAFRRVLAETGCAIIGQTDRLAPADRKLYALRDVTATVPSIPLITASIMSKKLAEGAGILVFDVKCGRGAFMRTPAQARALAASLLNTGRAMGRRVAALVTDMEQPLGRTAGNAVEVAESVAVLQGRGPTDVRELTLALTAQMTVLAGIHPDAATATRELAARLDDGHALEVFRRMVAAQGGDPRVAVDPAHVLPQPGASLALPAPQDGFVAFVDAERIGRAVLQLGAGRRRTDDAIDPAAGIDSLVQCGERVSQGQPLLRLLARDRATAESVRADVAAAFTFTDRPCTRPPLVQEVLT
jgi:pyrimidine-nucleoside phosphorylase